MGDISFLQTLINFEVNFKKCYVGKKPRHIQAGWNPLERSLRGLSPIASNSAEAHPVVSTLKCSIEASKASASILQSTGRRLNDVLTDYMASFRDG